MVKQEAKEGDSASDSLRTGKITGNLQEFGHSARCPASIRVGNPVCCMRILRATEQGIFVRTGNLFIGIGLRFNVMEGILWSDLVERPWDRSDLGRIVGVLNSPRFRPGLFCENRPPLGLFRRKVAGGC